MARAWWTPVRLAEPFFLRNLVVFPLVGPGDNGTYCSLQEALQSQEARLLDTEDIQEVVLQYRGNQPLVMMEGEEVLGARQNRVFVTTLVAERPVETRVPVVCVEQGRWSGGTTFRPSDTVAYPSLRAILSSSVFRNLTHTQEYQADQAAVWDSVRTTLSRLQVHSQTQSLHDSFEQLQDFLEDYLEDARFPEDTRGLVSLAGGRILGLDLFASPALFQKFQRWILRGYTLEAVMLMHQSTPYPDPEGVERFLETVQRLPYRRFPGVIHGEEHRALAHGVAARATVHRQHLVHLSAFPVAAA